MDQTIRRLNLGDQRTQEALAQIEVAKQFPLKTGKIVVTESGSWKSASATEFNLRPKSVL